jgi:hypothetical protein
MRREANMGELLQHCIRLPDNLNQIYINELQLKLKNTVERFKEGNLPSDETEITIKNEIESSLKYVGELELFFKAYEKSDDTPIEENIEVSSYFDYLALESEPNDVEPFIDDGVKNKYAYWNKVKTAYKMGLLRRYEFFLQGLLQEIFETTQDSAYWKIREEKVLKSNLTPCKPLENPRETEIEKHYLMRWAEQEYPILYQAMKKAIEAKFIVLNNNFLDFKCDRGCVGLFFREGGNTEYKALTRYVLINGEKPAETTLENGAKNTPPNSWESMKKMFF